MTFPDPKKINVYLACPYYHPSPSMRNTRGNAATRYIGHLVDRGITVFSPITHGHAIRHVIKSPPTLEFWLAIDLPILRICQNLEILTLSGWSHSYGINQEIGLALELDIPIHLIDPTSYSAWGTTEDLPDLSSPDPDTQSTTKEPTP